MQYYLAPAHEDFGDAFERRGAQGAGFFHRFFALLLRRIQVPHFHVHRRLVVEHRHLRRVLFDL